ncbi:phosphotransferase [Virgibacillus pantothenticus]|uniref:phosphotransferase n=2 Tax=Virgibacillus pantothenticus TaxID=1473 RepID=UPI0020B35878|nr:phosphotransferase [Virgibacillus pantothenticus]MEB5452483.1 phosphotransferase [Virgibacillus pantothenticus]MEB5460737.1 phosphotransferase [Virgibacillus pantothenticus]MEB5464976.1 phosphotransferase [Virgibacillus pantothenticus]
MMEYIKGKTLGERLIAKELPLDEVISLTVEEQQRLHNVTIHSSDLEQMKEKLKQQINAADQLEQLKKTKLLQLLEEIADGDKLFHGDFHLFNLIAANNRMTIIDWVDATVRDIHADVNRSYLLYSQYSQEIVEKYPFLLL